MIIPEALLDFPNTIDIIEEAFVDKDIESETPQALKKGTISSLEKYSRPNDLLHVPHLKSWKVVVYITLNASLLSEAIMLRQSPTKRNLHSCPSGELELLTLTTICTQF